MDVQFEQNGGALVVTPRFKRLDAQAAATFRTAVGERVSGARLVVVSLAQVTFIDSSGLAALISVLKRIPAGGQLRLAHANSSVLSLLTLTRLDKVLPSFDTVDKALAG
ncbi:anti-sigma B factor antagonist [Archangium gephyra]|uniref:Anti-sigma factor antagonist n=1 Tax=Archangium gephyra TaxID=48 RepID=A0AAC8QHR1_9BACT|nr:STAS domain-containing protein [Archangium gephyra]AKJ07736.1 Anti-sigma F factor antagonist [Archangium gephyra]REG29489.1 anti-sigma B factor antagonist [Archangium gephyra]